LENSNAAAVRKYSNQFNAPLNESTVRSIKKSYIEAQDEERKKRESMVLYWKVCHRRSVLIGESWMYK